MYCFIGKTKPINKTEYHFSPRCFAMKRLLILEQFGQIALLLGHHENCLNLDSQPSLNSISKIHFHLPSQEHKLKITKPNIKPNEPI